MTKHRVTETCEICGYQAKDDPTVVILCEDEIYRCKVCRSKAKYGRYISDKELLDMSIDELSTCKDWNEYKKELENLNKMGYYPNPNKPFHYTRKV